MVALERDVARILVTIRSAVGRTAPINRLPPDILARTLEFREGEKDLIYATHICHQWRCSALIPSPSPWTEAVFRNSNRVLTYLTRSGALLVNRSLVYTHLISLETWKFDPEGFCIGQIP